MLGGYPRDLDLTVRKLFGRRGYNVFEKGAEDYHLQFTQHIENFQSYHHLTFPEGIEKELKF